MFLSRGFIHETLLFFVAGSKQPSLEQCIVHQYTCTADPAFYIVSDLYSCDSVVFTNLHPLSLLWFLNQTQLVSYVYVRLSVELTKFYVVLYPILRTVQSAVHFTPVTCSIKHHLSFSRKNPAMLQLMHKDCSYKNMSIAKYAFLQQNELEQCRVKTFTQGLTWQHMIRTQVHLVESPKI